MAPAMSVPVTEPSRESLTEFVIKQGHGVKGLSDLGLTTLPKQYVQPLHERSCTLTTLHDHSIPVIDMSTWDSDPNVAHSLCDAAETWGFFQIINHGVPLHVLQNVKNATKRFFELGAEEKIKYTKEYTGCNNVWYGTSFSPDAEKALEWKDYLSLFYVSDDEASTLWPPQCRDEVLEYMKRSEVVIKKMLEALMKRLGVNEIDKTKESQLMGSKRVNLNYYPVCPNPDLTVGVGRHSDVSTLTFLLQDDIGGLYVRGKDGESWIHVSPVSGSIVINVGDALQIMSNGRYKSVEHRVVANGSKNRVSVPIFINPRPNDIIGPMSEAIIAGGEKPIYKQVRYSDYVKHFFKKAHDGKNSVDFVKL